VADALDTKTNDTPAANDMSCCGRCDAWIWDGVKPVTGKPRMGICRAGPPTPFLMQGPPHPLQPQTPTIQVMAQFPPMPEGGWCREYDDGMEID
jgi:hypothetical protein